MRRESHSPLHAATAATINAPSTDMNPMTPPPAPLVCHVRMRPQRSHTNCHDNGPTVTQSSRLARKVIEGSGRAVEPELPGRAAEPRYADVGVDTHSGRASVRSTHSAGTDPAFPEPITPPTMAHVVSTSPPTCAVVQKARS